MLLPFRHLPLPTAFLHAPLIIFLSRSDAESCSRPINRPPSLEVSPIPQVYRCFDRGRLHIAFSSPLDSIECLLCFPISRFQLFLTATFVCIHLADLYGVSTSLLLQRGPNAP